ncbi:hypothetical protein Taro_016152, partial [Colocasia esculenta]|nr:hypothetical protein [Colocasia esculenta]
GEGSTVEEAVASGHLEDTVLEDAPIQGEQERIAEDAPIQGEQETEKEAASQGEHTEDVPVNERQSADHAEVEKPVEKKSKEKRIAHRRPRKIQRKESGPSGSTVQVLGLPGQAAATEVSESGPSGPVEQVQGPSGPAEKVSGPSGPMESESVQTVAEEEVMVPKPLVPSSSQTPVPPSPPSSSTAPPAPQTFKKPQPRPISSPTPFPSHSTSSPASSTHIHPPPPIFEIPPASSAGASSSSEVQLGQFKQAITALTTAVAHTEAVQIDFASLQLPEEISLPQIHFLVMESSVGSIIFEHFARVMGRIKNITGAMSVLRFLHPSCQNSS